MLRCLSLASSFVFFLSFSSNTHTHSGSKTFYTTKLPFNKNLQFLSKTQISSFLGSLLPSFLPSFALSAPNILSLCHNNNTLKESKASLCLSLYLSDPLIGSETSGTFLHFHLDLISDLISLPLSFFISSSSFFCFHFFYHIENKTNIFLYIYKYLDQPHCNFLYFYFKNFFTRF